MSSITAEIEKYKQENNVPGLCELVPQVVATRNEDDRTHLLDAIEGILQVWMYDFHCGKGGDPTDYPYAEGIDALQILSDSDKTIDRVEYILICGDFRKRENDLAQAQEYYKQSETILKPFIHENPDNGVAYSNLIYTYQYFPTNDPLESEIFLVKALDLVAERFNATADGFYLSNLYLLYQDNIPAHLVERFQNQRRAFFAECYEKAIEDPIFALKMGTEFHRWLTDRELPTSPEIELEILRMLEAATLCATSEEKFDLITAGHTFSTEGARFKRDDFLLVAESLFSRALKQPGAFSLIYVYIAQVKEKRAVLFDNSCLPEQAQALREEIKSHYLRNWKLFSDDISYLSHATEYLIKSVESIPAGQIQPALLRDICLMALAAERAGECHYWYPYGVLFSAFLLMEKENDAKLWLGRGYRALNIVVEDKIKETMNEAIKKKASNDVISFIQKLIYHLDHHVDKTFWPGSPPHAQISQMTLVEIETWLATR
tara:strand:+ start:6961 stop:8430 length:1470 start_codon:yes stop_codon:yes gene_type:complete